MSAEPRQRHQYLPAPVYRNLDRACVQIRQAFGTPYLVGSATQRPDYRDVDVRVIVCDDQFLQLFPGRADAKARMESNMRWSIICSLVSQHLSQITGLEIDFQIQSMTQANAEKGTNRIPLGVVPVLDDPTPAASPSGAVGGHDDAGQEAVAGSGEPDGGESA